MSKPIGDHNNQMKIMLTKDFSIESEPRRDKTYMNKVYQWTMKAIFELTMISKGLECISVYGGAKWRIGNEIFFLGGTTKLHVYFIINSS